MPVQPDWASPTRKRRRSNETGRSTVSGSTCLRPAVEALARRASIPVAVCGEAPERLPDQVELAAYFVVSEALTNVAKHASARAAAVSLDQESGVLRVTVTDNGVGGAQITAGSGLAGLRDRLDALDATLAIESEPGAGTTIRAELSCE